MKNIYILLIILFTAYVPFSFAGETVMVESKGSGETRQKAIINALTNAVGQIKGVEIRTSEDKSMQSVLSKNTQIGNISTETDKDDFKAYINGVVKTYEILSENKTEDLHEVTLKAWVYNLKSRLQDDREKIAIMPCKTLKDNYSFKNRKFSATEISEKLQSKISGSFSRIGKLAVIDRQYVSDFLDNRNLLKTGQGSTEEKARLNNLLAVEYMLSSTLVDAKLIANHKYLSAIQKKSWEYELDFILDYKIIDASTTKVIFSDSIKYNFETNEVKKLVDKWDHHNLDMDEILNNLLKKTANQVAQKTLINLFPVKIIAITPKGKIIINQGNDKVFEGQTFKVVSGGQKIMDIDTKQVLGYHESKVTTLKIVKVDQKFSYAEVVAGNISDLRIGQVCQFD